MSIKLNKIFVALGCAALLVLSLPANAVAQDIGWVGLSSIKARSLALGGAFTAATDPLLAWDFNPAGAGFCRKPHGGSLQSIIYFNAMGPAILLANTDYLKDGLSLLGTTLKGLHVSIGPLSIGGVFGEQVLNAAESLPLDKMLTKVNYIDNRNSSIGVALSLGKRVSIGASTEIYKRPHEGREHYKIGYRYGVHVKTRNNIDVGLFFSDLPELYKEDRLAFESIGDETLNIGIAYHPVSWLTVLTDLRNVSDENKPLVREAHAGIEGRPVRELALRAGYYQDADKAHVFSAGFGFGNLSCSGARMLLEHIRAEFTYLQKYRHGIVGQYCLVTALIVI